MLLYLLITYCLIQQRVYQLRVHNVEEMYIWQGLQQSAVDSANDGECAFASVYGQSLKQWSNIPNS